MYQLHLLSLIPRRYLGSEASWSGGGEGGDAVTPSLDAVLVQGSVLKGPGRPADKLACRCTIRPGEGRVKQA